MRKGYWKLVTTVKLPEVRGKIGKLIAENFR